MTASRGIRSRRMPKDKYTDLERFFAKVDVGDCWLWTAGLDQRGSYAQFSAEGKTVRAHRWLYQRLVRKLRKTEDLDHLCRVRHCVNPDHLQPVTRSVNLQRGIGGILLTNWRREHAKRVA